MASSFNPAARAVSSAWSASAGPSGSVIGGSCSHRSSNRAVRTATLAYSVDGGATWLPLHVSNRGASFRAIIPGQALRPGCSVSLRTTARDGGGATVDQTVLGLFRVGAAG